MSKTLLVLLTLTVLISVAEFTSVRMARHVDLRLIPLRSRRRVAWMLSNSGHFQAGCAVAIATVLAWQVGLSLITN